ncbi:hypothetical protein [Spirosoma linguale]|uniref:hypothetical protein n=1 Tax=Spirosoma linguale TaxID=108 RepID=UPI0001A3BACE
MKNLFCLLLLGLLFACSKNSNDPKPPVTIDMSEVTMYYDGSHQFVLNQGSVRVQATDYTWSVSKPYAGTISPSGLFTAKHIGENIIIGTPKTTQGDVVRARVTVQPYYTTWGSLVTNWGVNKAAVKLAETRFPQSESSVALLYYGETDKIRTVLYFFDNSGLASVSVLPQNTSDLAKETATFLKERYDYLGQKDGLFAFSDNNMLGVALQVDLKAGLAATYFPYKRGGRLATDSLLDIVNRHKSSHSSLSPAGRLTRRALAGALLLTHQK